MTPIGLNHTPLEHEVVKTCEPQGEAAEFSLPDQDEASLLDNCMRIALIQSQQHQERCLKRQKEARQASQ